MGQIDRLIKYEEMCEMEKHRRLHAANLINSET